MSNKDVKDVKYEFFAQNKYLTCTYEENTQLKRHQCWSFYHEKINTERNVNG